ncbi:MAG: GNAT family N-acetyltransferase [Xanthobacteraceae bacterium]
MTTAAEIDLASPADVAGILDLQRENLPDRGGALSVEFSREWFAAAIAAMPVVVARRQGSIVGFLVSSPFAAHAHVPIVQAMLRAYPVGDDAYLYGPICIAASERGRGLAGRLFAALRSELPGREGVLFIRRDNPASLQAHAKMGMREAAGFIHDDAVHVVLTYIG